MLDISAVVDNKNVASVDTFIAHNSKQNIVKNSPSISPFEKKISQKK